MKPNSRLLLSTMAATSLNKVIGKDGGIPWNIPGEQKLFQRYTSGKIVVMGKATWASLPEAHRPLKGRLNMVLTSTPEYNHGDCVEVTSVQEAIMIGEAINAYDEMVFIGGQRVFAEALPLCSRLYLTEIEGIYPGDRYFPDFDKDEWHTVATKYVPLEKNGVAGYTFKIYER